MSETDQPASAKAKAIDLHPRTVLRLSGADRVRFLNGQVSNDVGKASPTQAITACVTTIKGKLDALVHITTSDDGESFLIDAEPELRESLFARLDRYIVADDCELQDCSADWRLVHVLEKSSTSDSNTRNSQRLGIPGTDHWLPVSDPALEFDFLDAAEAEALRIRNAVPKWGAELTPDTLPAEAGLDRDAIDFHKGCYIGQEVISRIKSVGRVNRHLVRLRVTGGESDSALALQPGQLLLPSDAEDGDSKEVGKITSSAAPEALGFVKRDHSAPGTQLRLASAEKKFLSTKVEIVEAENIKPSV